MIAGTAAGGTGARLFLNPSLVAETGADKIIKTKSTGLLDSSIVPTSWTLVKKTSDESVTSDNTLTADSALQFSMAANTTYVIRGFIIYSSTSATPDFKFDFTGATSPTALNGWWHGIALNADASTPTTDQFNTYLASAGTLTGTDTGYGWIRFEIFIKNASNTGTFSFRWAQNTSDATATTVNKGSYLEYLTT